MPPPDFQHKIKLLKPNDTLTEIINKINELSDILNDSSLPAKHFQDQFRKDRLQKMKDRNPNFR